MVYNPNTAMHNTGVQYRIYLLIAKDCNTAGYGNPKNHCMEKREHVLPPAAVLFNSIV